MKYKAHDYQQYATDFIITHPVSCLILDMGLGKTVITLTALWLLLFDYFEIRRVLVIAPKRVAETTWPAEIKKWEHLYGMTFAVAMGTAVQRKEAIMSRADVTIIGNGNYIWQPSVREGEPDKILNRPYRTSIYVPELAAGNRVMAFGDYSYYWIADRQGRSFKRLNELYATTGQVGFLASERVDGKLILSEAVKTLDIKAAGK